PLVYDELRRLAAAWLAHEALGQILDATALFRAEDDAGVEAYAATRDDGSRLASSSTGCWPAVTAWRYSRTSWEPHRPSLNSSEKCRSAGAPTGRSVTGGLAATAGRCRSRTGNSGSSPRWPRSG